MREYVVVAPTGAYLLPFKSDGQRVTAFDWSEPVRPGETPFDVIKRMLVEHGGFQIASCTGLQTELVTGEYYPRMARMSTRRPVLEWLSPPEIQQL